MFNIILGSVLFLIGGFGYYILEVLWRGYSDFYMIIVGGICFVICGMINEVLKCKLWVQILMSVFIITGIEYISGYILNIKMGLEIWDYSNLPLNINGQVCVLFSILWGVLSVMIIRLDDRIRGLYWKFVDWAKGNRDLK